MPVDSGEAGDVLVDDEIPIAGAAGAADETDFAVSIVLLLPIVDVTVGILAARGGRLGAKMAAAFVVVGVAGAAVGGAAITAP